MEQASQSLEISYDSNREAEHRDQVGFWLVALMLCLLPIERMVLPYNLKVVDLLLVSLMLCGLVKAWRTHQRLEFPLIVPMWLILVSSLVATQFGFAEMRSIVAIVQEIYLYLWFIVLTNLLRTFPPSDLDRLMKIWAVIALMEATTTMMGMLRIGPRIFYTAFFYEEPFRERIIATEGLSRAVGTYINPNAAAAYLSISFFVVLATSWPFWLRSVSGIWLLAGMFGTGSMGALLSTLGSLVVLLVVNSAITSRQARLLWGIVAGIGASVLTILLVIIGPWFSRLLETGFDANVRLLALTVGRLPHSIEGRLTRIENYWPVYILHPLGTGPDSSASLELSLHNDYVAFLFERGPVGVIGWLWLVAATLIAPLSAACRSLDSYHRWPAMALGAGFLASAINAFFHEVSHFRQMWVLMAFLFTFSYFTSVRATTSYSACRCSTSN